MLADYRSKVNKIIHRNSIGISDARLTWFSGEIYLFYFHVVDHVLSTSGSPVLPTRCHLRFIRVSQLPVNPWNILQLQFKLVLIQIEALQVAKVIDDVR